jgi:hypothetical protein
MIIDGRVSSGAKFRGGGRRLDSLILRGCSIYMSQPFCGLWGNPSICRPDLNVLEPASSTGLPFSEAPTFHSLETQFIPTLMGQSDAAFIALAVRRSTSLSANRQIGKRRLRSNEEVPAASCTSAHRLGWD